MPAQSSTPATLATLPNESLKLLAALQQGATLRWTPNESFVCTMPSGKQRQVRLGTAWQLRRAGLIEADTPDMKGPRIWTLTRAGQSAAA